MYGSLWRAIDTYVSMIHPLSTIMLSTQALLVVFHGVNAYLSINAFKVKARSKSFFVLRSFCVLNIVCALWRVHLFYTTLVYGPDMSPSAQFVSPLLIVAAFSTLWFLVPTLIKLPSLEALSDLNNQLALKIKELEKETQEKERVQNTLLQSQKMEAVGRLTGGIAHDFNNLLFAVSGSLELIKRNPQSERLDRWLDSAAEAVSRAAQLTAQLLTFSRVQRLQLKEVKLQPLMNNAKDLLKRTIGPDVTIVMPTIPNTCVMADSVQLELAILNLSLNSRDAMPEGGTITLSVNIIDEFIEICVCDTGTGISPDVVGRVFEPFFTTKDVGKGTGLGLSMVYGVATQSGGDVYIKQTSTKGTTIAIKLPIIESTEVELIEEPCIEPECNTTVKNIFVIDDEPGVRDILCDMLSSLGHNVTASEDGVDALGKLKEFKPDLILLDYAMPVMNGAEVAKAARLIYPDLNIVFVTGYSQSSALEGQTVIKKPFKLRDIEQVLDTFFEA